MWQNAQKMSMEFPRFRALLWDHSFVDLWQSGTVLTLWYVTNDQNAIKSQVTVSKKVF